MGACRELVWFYVRPTLHAALAERAARRGRDLEVEIVEILESAAIGPKTKAPRGRGQLRLVATGEIGPKAS